MQRLFKKSIGFVVLAVLMIGTVFPTVHALSFEGDFAGPLLQANDQGEQVFNLGIDQTANLIDNMKAIFYPDVDADNAIWKAIRNISVGVLLAMLVWSGVKFLMWSAEDEEERKNALRNIMYLIFGGALIFLAVWVLGTGLDITSVQGVAGDAASNNSSLLERFENNIAIVILSFFKGLAFFAAIVMLVYYAYRMLSAFGEEEKFKTARVGLLNVFLALIFIKVIDYIFLIAAQENFKNNAVNLIVQVSKFLGYLCGILFVVALIYAGYLFITSNGNDEQVSQAKKIVKSVFIVALIILLFMLVIFQVFNDLIP